MVFEGIKYHLGGDHFYHATGYFYLAAHGIGISDSSFYRPQRQTQAITEFNPYISGGGDNGPFHGSRFEAISEFDS